MNTLVTTFIIHFNSMFTVMVIPASSLFSLPKVGLPVSFQFALKKIYNCGGRINFHLIQGASVKKQRF